MTMIDINKQVLSSRLEANCQRSTVSGSGAKTETVNNSMANLENGASGSREQVRQPLRRRLPETRKAITHKFDVAGNEGYLTVGLFEDGQPGELFVTMALEGSTIGGLMDSIDSGEMAGVFQQCFLFAKQTRTQFLLITARWDNRSAPGEG